MSFLKTQVKPVHEVKNGSQKYIAVPLGPDYVQMDYQGHQQINSSRAVMPNHQSGVLPMACEPLGTSSGPFYNSWQSDPDHPCGD